MKIRNHRLEDHWYKQSPNIGGALTNPTILVMHFTASGGPDSRGDANYLSSASAKASAHIVIGRDGSIQQIVEFDQKAWHAGKSIWRGKANCNDFSIGIEIDNWGKLTQTADGKFRSWTGEVVPPNRVAKAMHKNEKVYHFWETFTDKQLLALEEVTKTILAAYPSIKEIVGHDDIAPGRKTDPGPMFPMSRFKGLVQGRGDRSINTRVTIANLNVRGGPSTSYDVIRTIKKGDTVEVVYDIPGDWAQIKDGGWVNDRYLR